MQLLKLSNLFNAITQAHPTFNHYHFGWRSDVIQNIPNNFDPNSSTGKMFPAVHFVVPEQISTSLSEAENKDIFQVTLYFDHLQDYNNNGTANTKTLIRQWSELAIIAKEYLYNVQRLLERDYSDLRMDTDSFRISVDSEVGEDKLITVKATFDITTFGECISVDLEPSTLPSSSSSLYPAVGGYDYEDLFNLVDVPVGFDRCQVIYDSLTQADKDCLLPLLGGGTCDWNDCTALLAGVTEATKNTCILPTYDFTNTDVQSNVTTQQQTDLTNWLCVAGCVADFSVSTLSQAEQIAFNEGQTVCIADDLHTAVSLQSVSGYIKGQIEKVGNTFYYVVSDVNDSLLSFDTQANILYNFDNSKPEGANPTGKPFHYNNKLYIQTNTGGANNLGTFCTFDLITNQVNVLFDFSSTTGYDNDNDDHARDVTVHNDKIYIAKPLGGANGCGTLLCYDLVADNLDLIVDLQVSANVTNTANSKNVGWASMSGDVLRMIYRDRYLTYNTITQAITDIQLGITGDFDINCAHYSSNDRLYLVIKYATNTFDTFVFDASNGSTIIASISTSPISQVMWEDAGFIYIADRGGIIRRSLDITDVTGAYNSLSVSMGYNTGGFAFHFIDDLEQYGNTLVYATTNQSALTNYLMQTSEVGTLTNAVIVDTTITVLPTSDPSVIDINQSPIFLR